MLDNLHKSATHLRDYQEELADLDRRVKDAREKLQKAAELGPITDPQSQKQARDPLMILSLCEARRIVLVAEIPRLCGDVVEQLRTLDMQLDDLISAAVTSARDEHIAKVTKALGGDEEAARATSNLNALPLVAIADRARKFNHAILALEDHKRGNPPGGKVAEIALAFIRHARQVAKAMGFTLPEETAAS